MLVEEHRKMKIERLVQSVNPNQFKGLTTRIKNLYPKTYNKLIQLKKKFNVKRTSEIIYLILNDFDAVPECPGLSKKCKHKLLFKSLNDGYCRYCKNCYALDPDFVEKRKETNMEKYGCEFPNKNEFVKQKAIQTNLKKYGVKNVKQIKKGENMQKNKNTNQPKIPKFKRICRGNIASTKKHNQKTLTINCVIGNKNVD